MHNQGSDIGSQAQRALGLRFWCPCLNNFLTKGSAFSFCTGVLKIMGVAGPAKKSHSKVENDIEEELTVPEMMAFLVKKMFLLNSVYHGSLEELRFTFPPSKSLFNVLLHNSNCLLLPQPHLCSY